MSCSDVFLIKVHASCEKNVDINVWVYVLFLKASDKEVGFLFTQIPIHPLHRIYQWGKTILLPFLRAKFRNQTMLTMRQLLNIWTMISF